MRSTLLIDVGPAVGAHGQRGIGRYVRGLVASISTFPDDLRGDIWAVGSPGPSLAPFGDQGIPSTGGPPGLPGWAAGRVATGAALRRSGARSLHSTDPQRPWTPGRAREIVTAYDLIPMRESEMLRSWRPDHRMAYRWYLDQLRRAARVLAISRTTAEELQELLDLDPARVDIVYPLVVAPETVRRVVPAEPTFICVGAVDVHKQPELAVRAFARFAAGSGRGRLRFLGPPNPAREQRLRELSDRLGIARLVSFEGRVSDVELDAAYASATALVTTSRIEGFGLPAIEAVLRGLPVVAVDTRAARETLGGVATIVPADPEAIAEAIANPLIAPQEAVTATRERYSIASVSRSLADSYRRSLG